MHVAQAFDIPGVVFFGSVSPDRIITNNNIHSVSATHLDCIGCHHRQKVPCVGTHYCAEGNLACENEVTIDQFWQKVQEVMSKKRIMPSRPMLPVARSIALPVLSQ